MTEQRFIELKNYFRETFGQESSYFVRAPGRVNLIGEHTDYNGGLVLPMAIRCEVCLLARPRGDRQFRLRSLQMEKTYDRTLPKDPLDEPGWVNYVFGVVHEFEKEGLEVPGFDALYDGDVPVGSGLSSSAAMEVASAWFIHNLLKTNHTRLQIALLSQRAENNFTGVRCGLMDQAISACAEDGCALKLNCATVKIESIPNSFSNDARFLIAHSGVYRGLSVSRYNERRSECQEALERICSTSGKNYDNLCSVPIAVLNKVHSSQSDILFRRARHVIREQERVIQAVDALRKGDAKRFGELLNSSHEFLVRDYEVSCPELDELTSWLRSRPGVFGSRLTGAGFGGCTISLVQKDMAQGILSDLKSKFYGPRSIDAPVFFSGAEPGASCKKY